MWKLCNLFFISINQKNLSFIVTNKFKENEWVHMSGTTQLSGADIPDKGTDAYDDLENLFNALDQVYVGDDASTQIESSSEYGIGIDTSGDDVSIVSNDGVVDDIPIKSDGQDITEIQQNITEVQQNITEAQGDIETSVQELENELESIGVSTEDGSDEESGDVDSAEEVMMEELPSDADYPSGSRESLHAAQALTYDTEAEVPDNELADGTLVKVGDDLFVVDN